MQYSNQTSDLTYRDSSYPLLGLSSDEVVHSPAIQRVIDVLSVEGEFRLNQARTVLERALQEDSRADHTLVAIANSGDLSEDAIIHLIRTFEVVCSKTSLLHHLLQIKSPEPRVKSKVALTVGRLAQNLKWLNQQLSDPDHRVRANVIEGLWNVQVEGIEQILAQAARDPHHRVVGNAACAYYKLGRLEAFELCRFLLSHSNTVARRAGLWAVRHIGDPRFLDFLHNNPIEPADDLERAARVQTINYLGERLNLASFADVLSLHLIAVNYDSKGWRRIQFQCIPSDPRVPLLTTDFAAVNFTLEEDGQDIGSFECRWLPADQVTHFHVLAPEGLRFRHEMMLPHPSITTPETIVITRFEEEERSLSLVSLLNRGIGMLEALHGSRHLLVVLDRSRPLSLSDSDVARLRSAKIQLHALVNGQIPEDYRRGFADLCAETGGNYVRTSAAQEVERQLHLIRAKSAGVVELAWRTNVQRPSSISVQCYGSYGFGEMMF